ncbi:hypothetical protein HJFPF1_01815 [Paramyrothecium foliicola]|nr:hypothetical protein HJFPF1_01815 [Paramyrothecium foliicola]
MVKDGGNSADKPPAYSEQHGHLLEAGDIQLPTHFGPLDLAAQVQATPTADTCLAHLRLLHTFEKLKHAIGYQDGLWDIWDNRAASAPNEIDVLVIVREKRWALYVARAVERYEAWWRSFVPDMLLEKDMIQGDQNSARYEGFLKADPVEWNADMLPPIDVLLVWHAHLLNPRFYLEDCLRFGHRSIWAAGLPWHHINAAIDEQFNFSVDEACIQNWTARTGKNWLNAEDSLDKETPCFGCGAILNIPWTTCGLPRDYTGDKRPGLAGQGYGDGQLNFVCDKCGLKLTHDSHRVYKFRTDVQALVAQGRALPGTILDLKTGLPKLMSSEDDDRLFPSRLIQRGLLVEVVEKLKPGATDEPSMAMVRDMMERITHPKGDIKALQNVEGKRGIKGVRDATLRISLISRQQTRRMMARYWQNSTFAALDLNGAVMRQGVFSQKMVKIDWLHSPASRATMERLLLKYSRFIDIMAKHPTDAAVPTLDVDLAWHTHQLSPMSYLRYTTDKTTTFVDHNDKVDEDKLGTAFEWTCKVYMEQYGEPYSECTCWYCESVRFMNLSGLGKLFRTSKEEKGESLEQWHASGEGSRVPQPPTAESAHLSSHPSVHTNETIGRRALTRTMRLLHQNKLNEAHAKAQKKATKSLATAGKSRMGPRGEDAARFWGKSYPLGGPSASSLAVLAAVIYANPPGIVEAGPGAVGSCAAGTCSGSSGCGSETLGICTASCTGNLPVIQDGTGSKNKEP